MLIANILKREFELFHILEGKVTITSTECRVPLENCFFSFLSLKWQVG